MPSISNEQNPISSQEASDRAILPLQRMYRLKHAAACAKQQIGLVKDDMVHFPFYLRGNEPLISIDKKFKRTDTKPKKRKSKNRGTLKV